MASKSRRVIAMQEDLSPDHDSGVPLVKTVLDGSELCELTLPFGMNTESFLISVLIEIGVVIAVSLDLDDSAIVLQTCGQSTRDVALLLGLRMNEHKW
jgi:hypothetical protein